MPAPVVVKKSADIQPSGSQTEGMLRMNALVDVAPDICSSVMVAKPHTASAVHHHGDENTMVYSVAGHGTIVSDGGRVRHALAPGDFALIPAFAEHQEVNDSDADVTWVIVRSGRSPIVQNLPGWTSAGSAASLATPAPAEN